MLARRYGETAMAEYREKRQASVAASENYIAAADRGEYAPIYRFGEPQITETDIKITDTAVSINGLANKITLPRQNPYSDMTD